MVNMPEDGEQYSLADIVQQQLIEPDENFVGGEIVAEIVWTRGHGRIGVVDTDKPYMWLSDSGWHIFVDWRDGSEPSWVDESEVYGTYWEENDWINRPIRYTELEMNVGNPPLPSEDKPYYGGEEVYVLVGVKDLRVGKTSGFYKWTGALFMVEVEFDDNTNGWYEDKQVWLCGALDSD